MHSLATRFRTVYGSHPLHLLTMLAGFALAGYAVATLGISALWNPHTWWQSIVVWFAAAVILHDLVAFPLYAAADRLLATTVDGDQRTRVPVRNYLRIPGIGAALTFVVFLPGIIGQGGPTYQAATGTAQDGYLARWLLLTASMFALSAMFYLVRWIVARRRSAEDG